MFHSNGALAGLTIADLAEVLGLGRDTIVKSLRRGRTLKDLAALAGMSLDDTITGLLARRRQQMEARLAKFGQDLQAGAGNALLSPNPRWVHPRGPTDGRFYGTGRGARPRSSFLPPGGNRLSRAGLPPDWSPGPPHPPEPRPEPPAAPPPGSPTDPPNER